MKTIIVEDEQNASNWLVNALGRLNAGINLLGIYSEPISAIEGIRTLKPELVFMDVDLNHEINGFGILDRVKDCEFKLIFTTGQSEHALAAFEYNAVQFLLKPYTDEKLREAIEKSKLLSLGEQHDKIEHLKITDKFLQKQTDIIPVRKASGDVFMVNVNDCSFLTPDGKSVVIYFNDGNEEEAEFRPFTDWVNILQERGFLRTQQKFLVNVRSIKKHVNRNKADITEDALLLRSQIQLRRSQSHGRRGSCNL